jgi:hypothetical protein
METAEIENNKKAAFCQTRRRIASLRRKTLRLSEKFACPVGFAILLAASPDLPAFLPMF